MKIQFISYDLYPSHSLTLSFSLSPHVTHTLVPFLPSPSFYLSRSLPRFRSLFSSTYIPTLDFTYKTAGCCLLILSFFYFFLLLFQISLLHPTISPPRFTRGSRHEQWLFILGNSCLFILFLSTKRLVQLSE